MKVRESGFTLVDCLVALAGTALLVTLGTPPLLSLHAKFETALAAEEVAVALRVAQAGAVRYGANVGVKFRTAPDGAVWFGIYRDGDGDGVRSDDIESGDDPRIGPERRLAHFGRSVRFGFPPLERAPRDPGDPHRRLADLDDPIRFNRSNIASYGEFGTATPGSVYLTDGRRNLFVVRVYGRTGRVSILAYDPDTETWR